MPKWCGAVQKQEDDPAQSLAHGAARTAVPILSFTFEAKRLRFVQRPSPPAEITRPTPHPSQNDVSGDFQVFSAVTPSNIDTCARQSLNHDNQAFAPLF